MSEPIVIEWQPAVLALIAAGFFLQVGVGLAKGAWILFVLGFAAIFGGKRDGA